MCRMMRIFFRFIWTYMYFITQDLKDLSAALEAYPEQAHKAEVEKTLGDSRLTAYTVCCWVN